MRRLVVGSGVGERGGGDVEAAGFVPVPGLRAGEAVGDGVEIKVGEEFGSGVGERLEPPEEEGEGIGDGDGVSGVIGPGEEVGVGVAVGVGEGVGVGHGFSKDSHSCQEAESLPPNSFQSAWQRSDQWA